MRILHIPNYYNPHIGGIEQVCEDVVNSLKINQDIEQKVICFKDAPKTTIDTVNDIEVIRCGCQTKVASQSISLGYGKTLKKVMNSFKPEIIIFHYPNPFVARLLLKYKKRDFKLILYWHLDITKQKLLGKLFNGQTIKLLKRANKVVCTSPNYLEGSKYLPSFKDKTIVIPNCVSQEKLLPTTEAQRLKANEIKENNQGKIICFALGRHVEYKGLKYLVEASKYLDDSFKIYIGGKGPLTKDLMNQAKGDNKIEFLGRVSDDDVVSYIEACDILCFPSITKNEAFGIFLAEGMARSKPAVTFTIDGSGVNYVSLNNVTGLEAPNCDSKAYADLMIKLANDANMREEFGKNARMRVIDNFTFDKFSITINELIKNI